MKTQITYEDFSSLVFSGEACLIDGDLVYMSENIESEDDIWFCIENDYGDYQNVIFTKEGSFFLDGQGLIATCSEGQEYIIYVLVKRDLQKTFADM